MRQMLRPYGKFPVISQRAKEVSQMREFVKPIIVVSKCLGFANCRYNGAIINDDFVEKLKNFVEFKTVCAEVEIGLGTPREPVRVVKTNGNLKLIQPKTGIEFTDTMKDFSNSFIDSIGEADGFILKSRSPSCGIKDVKIYPSAESNMVMEKGSGFFGGAVLEKFPYLPVEDEGRLTNFRIREHFLTSIYTFACFRKVKSSDSMKALVQFHSENKLQLMAYNQKEMRILGKITANTDKKEAKDAIKDYEQHLFKAFYQAPRYVSNINVLMHGLGYFSDSLSHEEKAFFLDSLEKYREGKVPLSVPLNILQSFIVRFKEDYLMKQTFFEPYPEGLVEITDSGKGRGNSKET
jgi:uncharacterized protein YbgA (DUF1722 family)/uncharacterized protein YbbK (DUF523 family)